MFDFLHHLRRQIEFSRRTFGPGPRTNGVIDHIRKELKEIEANPTDAKEWADVVILGLDGFWRAGYTPEQIIQTLVAKQEINEARKWPDWRKQSAEKAIEHDRSEETVRPTNTSAKTTESIKAVVCGCGHKAERVGAQDHCDVYVCVKHGCINRFVVGKGERTPWTEE